MIALCSGQIFACPGVDLQHVADVDEQRHPDNGAGFKRCRLEGVGCGVAGKTGIGVGNGKLHECGRLDLEDIALVGGDFAHHLFFDELERISDLVVCDQGLFPGFGIHEVIQISVVVGVLEILSFDISVLKLVRGGEGCLRKFR